MGPRVVMIRARAALAERKPKARLMMSRTCRLSPSWCAVDGEIERPPRSHNNKIRTITRRAYGFTAPKVLPSCCSTRQGCWFARFLG